MADPRSRPRRLFTLGKKSSGDKKGHFYPKKQPQKDEFYGFEQLLGRFTKL